MTCVLYNGPKMRLPYITILPGDGRATGKWSQFAKVPFSVGICMYLCMCLLAMTFTMAKSLASHVNILIETLPYSRTNAPTSRPSLEFTYVAKHWSVKFETDTFSHKITWHNVDPIVIFLKPFFFAIHVLFAAKYPLNIPSRMLNCIYTYIYIYI